MIRDLTLILFCTLTMQAAGLTGPMSGWTLDNRTSSIRAVVGIPGALRLADPLMLPNGIAGAEFSSSGDLAVAISTESPAHLIVLTALLSSPAVTDLGEIPADTRILALNRKGTAALLYSSALQTIRFVNGLDKAPSLSDPLSSAGLSGPISSGLLESSGTCAVLGTGSVETLCSDGTTRRVIPGAALAVTALALANSDQDLWVADAAGKQVLRVSNYAQQSAATPFATQADGLLHPVALAVTPAGQILVADADAQAMFVIDPAGVPAQQIALNVVPSQLRPLTDRTLLLINDLNSLPFTLFTSEGLRTYFVPAN